MGKILCPTRGGEGSYRTQDAAIAMAKERGDDLVFLYVVELDLLSMAQERAEKQGVTASYILREGEVQAEIKAAAVQEGATLVVLGQAEEDDPTCKFEPEKLFKFAEDIETETGIEARVIC